MVHQKLVQGGDKTDCAHYHDDTSHDAVEKPQGTQVEMSPDLVDKPCDTKPPQHGSGKNGYIARDIVIGLEFGRKEAEPGKESDYEKEYQRVGECEQETGDEIFPRAHGLHSVGLERAGWVGSEQVAGIDEQYHRSYQLKQALVVLDEIGYER